MEHKGMFHDVTTAVITAYNALIAPEPEPMLSKVCTHES